MFGIFNIGREIRTIVDLGAAIGRRQLLNVDRVRIG
jgi:hypothetical protein